MEAERSAAPDPLAEDLFGDDDQVVVERPARPQPADQSSGSELDEDPEKHALEYLEDDEAPPAPVVEERTAWLNVAQPPVRRTKPTVLARLPNFVRYRDQPFDADTWSEQQEEEVFRTSDNHDAEIGDKVARSVLRTSNTMRWRWQSSERGDTPQSNARIVRWSDGSESLQLGNEFYDISRHTKSSAPAQDNGKLPLTYLFVPHAKEGVLQAEGAVRTSLTFKPNIHSETHNRLASAIKHQRSARVVAGQEMFGALDPEREKERIERQLKETEKRKRREQAKANRSADDFDDDLDLNARRQGPRSAARRSRTFAEWSDDDEDLARDQTRHIDYEDDEDDGFIVNDEDEDDGGDGKGESAMSEDETELADRNIEEFERARREKREAENGRQKRAESE
ncbi:Paf1 complex component [Malassezia obtusa]|uniref:Paf1 complex component n=1 Tax=Malassezia obtusa TaxID=76774 RepID=A0AAF0E251_9BASI|nr:Paf1 complex component [Malassezia obtusa]